MSSVKDKTPVEAGDKFVILGASGNTGSIVANSLLSKGKKVRVVARDSGRLRPFVRNGAEAFSTDMTDSTALNKAFTGARAVYLLLPPIHSREDQERQSDAFAKAVEDSGVRYAVYLSSYGAHVPEGTGPIVGLHSAGAKTERDRRFERSAPARRIFYGKQSSGYWHDSNEHGIFGHVLLPDLKLPMIATRDVGNYAARAPAGPGLFRQTDARAARRARPER